MKKSILTTMGVLALLGSTASMAASTVQLLPSSATVLPNDTFTVAVLAAGFPGDGQATGVTGGSFTFTFDSTKVAILGAALPSTPTPNTAGNPFDFITPLTIIDPGTVALSVLRNGTTGFNYASGTFSAFVLSFQVLSAATSGPVNLVMIDDGIDNSWTQQDATALSPVDYSQASVTVNAVPVPAAAWLIAPAVLAAGRFSRRRKAA